MNREQIIDALEIELANLTAKMRLAKREGDSPAIKEYLSDEINLLKGDLENAEVKSIDKLETAYRYWFPQEEP
jgi:hypothetical protein